MADQPQQRMVRAQKQIPQGVTKVPSNGYCHPSIGRLDLQAVIQISQVGYHPDQPKTAIIELDKRDATRPHATLYSIDKTDGMPFATSKEWGQFLRYSYLKCDFSQIKEEGMYQMEYRPSQSSTFRIASGDNDEVSWQPVLEYFLPVQMYNPRERDIGYGMTIAMAMTPSWRKETWRPLRRICAQDAKMITKYPSVLSPASTSADGTMRATSTSGGIWQAGRSISFWLALRMFPSLMM